MTREDLSSSLVDTVAEKGGVDLLSDLGEVAFDAVMKDGVLKDVPVLGSLLQLVKLGFGVREYTFLKKLQKFASPLRDVSDADREKFREKIDQDPKFRARVGENLVLVLERLDDMAKPDLIGRLFAAYLSRRILYDTFLRLSNAVDRAFMPDLDQFNRRSYDSEFTDEWAQSLAACGLMTTHATSKYGEENNLFYRINESGRLLLEICFYEI
jgi:hypothetical protein